MPPAASHGTVSESTSTSLPAKSGPNTVGPRIAPKTEPNRTYEIPRARRSGGYISPAAVLIRSATPLAAPRRAKPTMTASVDSVRVASAVMHAAEGADGEAARHHRCPAEPIHQPACRDRGQAGRCEEDRRAEPEQPADARDEHERQRRDCGSQLQDRGVHRHRCGEDDRVPPDREARRRCTSVHPCDNSHNPPTV